MRVLLIVKCHKWLLSLNVSIFLIHTSTAACSGTLYIHRLISQTTCKFCIGYTGILIASHNTSSISFNKVWLSKLLDRHMISKTIFRYRENQTTIMPIWLTIAMWHIYQMTNKIKTHQLLKHSHILTKFIGKLHSSILKPWSCCLSDCKRISTKTCTRVLHCSLSLKSG